MENPLVFFQNLNTEVKQTLDISARCAIYAHKMNPIEVSIMFDALVHFYDSHPELGEA